MMENQFQRTELLLGKPAVEKLKAAHVAVFGVGGVGGYVVEALVRSGVSHFTLVDADTVSLTNLNRQIIATLDTVGQAKVEVMKQRILSINKDAEVETRVCFFLPENQDEFDFSPYDYVVDCVDTVSAKIAIILKAQALQIPVISSMGAGNKINPMVFMVSDIYKTDVDPLAKVMRHELKKRGVEHLKVVFSKEKPLPPLTEGNEEEALPKGKKSLPGSNAFVPSAAGLLIASEVIADLTNDVAREELKRK